jgi:hypothetical protein
LTQSACLAAVDVDEGRRGRVGGGESEDSGPGDGGEGRWLWIRDLGTQKKTLIGHIEITENLQEHLLIIKLIKHFCLKTEKGCLCKISFKKKGTHYSIQKMIPSFLWNTAIDRTLNRME